MLKYWIIILVSDTIITQYKQPVVLVLMYVT
jgi:hypothetical protein